MEECCAGTEVQHVGTELRLAQGSERGWQQSGSQRERSRSPAETERLELAVHLLPDTSRGAQRVTAERVGSIAVVAAEHCPVLYGNISLWQNEA